MKRFGSNVYIERGCQHFFIETNPFYKLHLEQMYMLTIRLQNKTVLRRSDVDNLERKQKCGWHQRYFTFVRNPC